MYIFKSIKNKLIQILIFFFFLFLYFWVWSAYTQAPSFEDGFANYLTDDTPDEYGRVETVFDLPIDKDKSLMENIRCLLYPNPSVYPGCNAASSWWFLWDTIRYAWFIIMFIFLVMTWVNLLLYPKDSDKVKSALKNIMYIWYWWFILLWSVRLLWTVLNISWLQWSDALVGKLQWWPSSLFFQVLTFLKSLAFFAAIIMMVILWFRIMSVHDPDKSKKIIKTIFNIVIALILIKVVDFLYYIAQSSEFASKSADFIIDIAKIVWYVLWATLTLMIFYAWYLMVTDQWKEESFKKAKNIIFSIVLSAIVLFLFLLILYQIFNEFA